VVAGGAAGVRDGAGFDPDGEAEGDAGGDCDAVVTDGEGDGDGDGDTGTDAEAEVEAAAVASAPDLPSSSFGPHPPIRSAAAVSVAMPALRVRVPVHPCVTTVSAPPLSVGRRPNLAARGSGQDTRK
jgi:hypothetical protein